MAEGGGMTALYVLASEYRAALSRLEELDLDEQTVADTLEGMAGEVEDKARNVVMFARNLEAAAAAIKDAEAQMSARRKSIERRAESLRRYVLSAMQATGITKIDCPQFAVSVRANPPSVDVFDPAQVPAEYMRQPEPPPPAPDKAAIKAALNGGHDVPGCRIVIGHRLEVR